MLCFNHQQSIKNAQNGLSILLFCLSKKVSKKDKWSESYVFMGITKLKQYFGRVGKFKA